MAPLCKGSCWRKPTEGLFFYNPSRRRLQACFAHSQIPPTAARFPNPSRRRLQACFAHSQIPSTTSWSPSPYTGEANSKLLSAPPFNQSRLCRTTSLRSSLFFLISKKPACQAGFLFHFSAFLTVQTSSPSFASTMSVSPISRSFERIVRATSVSTLPCKYLLSGLAP